MSENHSNSGDSNQVATFFNRQAKRWSETYYGTGGSLAPRVGRFAKQLDALTPKSGTVLDYGCGTGELAAGFVALGYRVEACDASPVMISRAREIHRGSEIDWKVVPESGESTNILPYGTSKFDAIVCSSVLEYLSNLPKNLAELSRILKPGGWLLATIPNIMHPGRRREPTNRWLMQSPLFRTVIGRSPWAASFELQWLSRNRFPVEQWEQLLHDAGFHPVVQDCQFHTLTLLMGQRSVS